MADVRQRWKIPRRGSVPSVGKNFLLAHRWNTRFPPTWERGRQEGDDGTEQCGNETTDETLRSITIAGIQRSSIPRYARNIGEKKMMYGPNRVITLGHKYTTLGTVINLSTKPSTITALYIVLYLSLLVHNCSLHRSCLLDAHIRQYHCKRDCHV